VRSLQDDRATVSCGRDNNADAVDQHDAGSSQFGEVSDTTSCHLYRVIVSSSYLVSHVLVIVTMTVTIYTYKKCNTWSYNASLNSLCDENAEQDK
jgi:hypothetical protein